MATFVVIARENPAAIKASIERQYGENHYEFSPNAWFVPDVGTTKDVMDKLGLTGGGIHATGVILNFNAYAGYGPGEAWQWLAKNTDAIVHG